MSASLPEIRLRQSPFSGMYAYTIAQIFYLAWKYYDVNPQPLPASINLFAAVISSFKS
jgi:hypothetical protein